VASVNNFVWCFVGCAVPLLELQVYVSAVEGMRTHDMTTLFVDFAHVQEYDEALASTIAAEFYRCGAA